LLDSKEGHVDERIKDGSAIHGKDSPGADTEN
jgi:hypothetical protein